MAASTGDRVVAVDGCSLRLATDTVWPLAIANAEAIADYWRQRQAENPALFNGKILLCKDYALRGARFEATFVRVDFADFLFWREHGFPDRTTFDAFGSALVHSVDGAILLGRAGTHTINAGRTYLPGGFIDDRDVRHDLSIDIDSSIARELLEETGIGARHVGREPGFQIVFAGQLIAIVASFRSAQSRHAVAAAVAAFIAGDPQPELAAAVMVSTRAELAGLTMPTYMQVLTRHLLDA